MDRVIRIVEMATLLWEKGLRNVFKVIARRMLAIMGPVLHLQGMIVTAEMAEAVGPAIRRLRIYIPA